jgi:hypothetical protein
VVAISFRAPLDRTLTAVPDLPGLANGKPTPKTEPILKKRRRDGNEADLEADVSGPLSFTGIDDYGDGEVDRSEPHLGFSFEEAVEETGTTACISFSDSNVCLLFQTV